LAFGFRCLTKLIASLKFFALTRIVGWLNMPFALGNMGSANKYSFIVLSRESQIRLSLTAREQVKKYANKTLPYPENLLSY